MLHSYTNLSHRTLISSHIINSCPISTSIYVSLNKPYSISFKIAWVTITNSHPISSSTVCITIINTRILCYATIWHKTCNIHEVIRILIYSIHIVFRTVYICSLHTAPEYGTSTYSLYAAWHKTYICSIHVPLRYKIHTCILYAVIRHMTHICNLYAAIREKTYICN